MFSEGIGSVREALQLFPWYLGISIAIFSVAARRTDTAASNRSKTVLFVVTSNSNLLSTAEGAIRQLVTSHYNEGNVLESASFRCVSVENAPIPEAMATPGLESFLSKMGITLSLRNSILEQRELALSFRALLVTTRCGEISLRGQVLTTAELVPLSIRVPQSDLDGINEREIKFDVRARAKYQAIPQEAICGIPLLCRDKEQQGLKSTSVAALATHMDHEGEVLILRGNVDPHTLEILPGQLGICNRFVAQSAQRNNPSALLIQGLHTREFFAYPEDTPTQSPISDETRMIKEALATVGVLPFYNPLMYSCKETITTPLQAEYFAKIMSQSNSRRAHSRGRPAKSKTSRSSTLRHPTQSLLLDLPLRNQRANHAARASRVTSSLHTSSTIKPVHSISRPSKSKPQLLSLMHTAFDA